ncbi:hephaestin-like protein [Glandiceps talaboti]
MAAMKYVHLSAAVFYGCFAVSFAATKVFFLASVEVEWNFAPTGENLINGMDIASDSVSSKNLLTGRSRIGAVYKKAVFKEYTDDTFTVEIPKKEWQGILGPIIKAEVNDVIEIRFKNLASREYSIHPHGLFYDKVSEGALYHDKTDEKQKKDDRVPPGGSHTYIWNVKEESGPTADDPSCIMWAYHSHVETTRDINTGLIGSIHVCRKGIYNNDRTDIDREFSLFFTIFNENKSWYVDDNIATYCEDPASVDKGDSDFVKSNLMYSINGYMYGNLPNLRVCAGDKVTWHLFGMGGENDMHSVHIHGHNLVYSAHRTDTVGLYPATFVTASMTSAHLGTWLLKCIVTESYDGGMLALLDVEDCGSTPTEPIRTGTTRQYYIQAEEMYWDYAPSGEDKFFGGTLDDQTSVDIIGKVYKKALYVEYTDGTFQTKKERNEAESYLGFLGPVIKAEVGDEIRVTFKNNADIPYSIHPHGVYYNKANEGARYADHTPDDQKRDDAISPGDVYVYVWYVPDERSPTESDYNCVTYMYYSHVNPTKDMFSGLFGPLLVCKQGSVDADNRDVRISSSADVNHEFFLMIMVVDENLSWYLQDNINEFCSNPNTTNLSDYGFIYSNMRNVINGYSYANLPNIEVCKADSIMWHLMNLGEQTVEDIGFHFHGNTLIYQQNQVDVIPLTPGMFRSAKMQADNPGTWAMACRTISHYRDGMVGLYRVDVCDTDRVPTGEKQPADKNNKAPRQTRRYFIVAIETEWDYAPSGYNLIKNVPLDSDPDSFAYEQTHRGDTTVGKVYKKALYREFTDETFSALKHRSKEEHHLGLLGPVVKAEVGEVIQIVFYNLASRNYSIHPHGVVYSKDTEGAPYKDGTSGNMRKDDGVMPGDTFTYTWEVPPSAGPTDDDPNCITWVYYSAVDYVRDTSSGLIGPLVVCKQGVLDADNKRTDVDKEFALLFSINDENDSWYLDENIQRYCGTPDSVDRGGLWGFSNSMHGINGLIYANLEGLEMSVGDTVEWYLIGFGTHYDIHPVHFHGETIVVQQSGLEHRADVYDLFPGVYKTVRMIAKNPGRWLLHCHVSDHIDRGMEATYLIKEKADENVSRSASVYVPSALVYIITLKLLVSHNAILETKRRMQPLQSKEGPSVWLCYDGKIYNTLKIQEKNGFKTSTGSDGDCFLDLYAKYGMERALSFLDGVYALILIDELKNKVFLGRDVYGVRPLFTNLRSNGTLAVSSEAKGLIGYVNNEDKDIIPFPPGHYDEYDITTDGTVSLVTRTQFHTVGMDPGWLVLGGYDALLGNDIKSNIRTLLIESVKKRMVSNRRIGCLISGGVDSSLVCAIVVRLAKERGINYPIQTFTVGMEGSTDLNAARQVADYLGTEHHEIVYTEKEGLDIIDDAVYLAESYDVMTIRGSIREYISIYYVKQYIFEELRCNSAFSC